MTIVRASLLSTMLLSIGCTQSDHSSERSPNSMETRQTTDHSKPVTADEVATKTREVLDVSGKFAAQSMDQFTTEAKRRLAEMDRKMKEWEAQSKPLTDDAKAKWNEQHELFQQRRAKLQQELDRLKESGGNAWNEMKEGSEAAWHELSEAFIKAAEHFQKDR